MLVNFNDLIETAASAAPPPLFIPLTFRAWSLLQFRYIRDVQRRCSGESCSNVNLSFLSIRPRRSSREHRANVRITFPRERSLPENGSYGATRHSYVSSHGTIFISSSRPARPADRHFARDQIFLIFVGEEKASDESVMLFSRRSTSAAA